MSVRMHAKTPQLCPTLCDPIDCSHQSPLSMGFSRQEYWSGLPCPPPGDLPDPNITGRFFTTEPLGKPRGILLYTKESS